jgi:putative tryptophan/tyrosine transport system substrate-binding protein
VLRDPAITAGIGLWGAIQSVAPSFGMELRPVDVRDAGELPKRSASKYRRHSSPAPTR